MPERIVRAARPEDLRALTDIYNHYVVHTPITFDLQPLRVEERQAWFDAHADHGRYRLLVAIEADRILGSASTSRFRVKAAYETTVEASIYCDPDATGRGVGTALYDALFTAIAAEDIHRIVAGVTLPNPASLALHARFGFQPIGTLSENGRKFGRFWDVRWLERPLIL